MPNSPTECAGLPRGWPRAVCARARWSRSSPRTAPTGSRRLWGDDGRRSRHRDQPAVHAGRGRAASFRLGGPTPGPSLHSCRPPARRSSKRAAHRHRRARGLPLAPLRSPSCSPTAPAAGVASTRRRPRAASVFQWHQRAAQRCAAHPSGLRGQRSANARASLLRHTARVLAVAPFFHAVGLS